jgi:Dolichyl-phosphate-mannose-protein mannosyltransferase
MSGLWSTSRATHSRFTLALVAVAATAFTLRALPFFEGAEGALGYRVDYDEGVYFSAASYLLQGVLPWKDYVFVHPPGLLYFLGATSAWLAPSLGVAQAFVTARWLAVALGVANTLLVARLSLNWGSRTAAVLAAAMYATYPEVVQVERGPFLEPLLNCVCLAMVEVSTRVRPDRMRALVLAGLLAGVAVSIKLWAVVWVLPMLLGLSRRRGLFLAVVAATALGLILPLALTAPQAFWDQVVWFHTVRPPDGTVGRLDRLGQIFSVRHLVSPLLASLAVVLLVVQRKWTSPAQVVVGAWALTLVAFFASAAWWNQYNAHLVASEAVVAALGFSLLSARWKQVLGLAAVVGLGASVSHCVRRARPVGSEHRALARSALRDSLQCVFTFEPGWAVVANRLPPRETGPLIDSYASQLLHALRGGQRFSSALETFGASPGLPAELNSCRYLVLGERGARQLALDAVPKGWRENTVDGLVVWERQPEDL